MQLEALPLISVIIPTYNVGELLAESLKSVFAQTYPRYEVIVVDDGSTDNTTEVVREFKDRILYLYQDNHGPSAARNKGIKRGQGKYFCFLDADDLWTPNKLEVQVAFMERHSDIGLVFSDCERFDSKGVIGAPGVIAQRFYLPYTPIPDAFMKLVMRNFIVLSTVMVRKRCLDKVGLFDENLRSVEDRDLWLRIAADFEIGYLPLILAKYRFHSSNISSDGELALRSLISVLNNNRRLFPGLVPAPVWNKRLADLYLKLGYSLLVKRHKTEAREPMFNSVEHGATIRAFGMILLTLIGWPIIGSLRWMRRGLLGASKVKGAFSHRRSIQPSDD